MLLITFVIFSCKKDEKKIRGCTDIKAPNFNNQATEDDGSCQPYGIVRFWPSKDYFYYVKIAGNRDDFRCGNGSGVCEPKPVSCDSSCISCGGAVLAPGTYNYEVYRDSNDSLIKTGTVIVSDGSCDIFEVD